MNEARHTLPGFVRHHSLSITAIAVLAVFIVLYSFSDGSGHLGSFFGNSIADWSGAVCVIIAAKYFIERGFAKSKPLQSGRVNPVVELLRSHSLTLILLASGFLWVRLYLKSDPNSKWGQVYGNLVSEWFQTIGTVWMTKTLVERGSRESKQR